MERNEVESQLDRQLRYERALAGCSQTLLLAVKDEQTQQQVLNQALEHLRSGALASRAYIFRNFLDDQLGKCLGIFSEACAPDIPPHINVSANHKVPWSQLPQNMYQKLRSRKSFGGQTVRIFNGTIYREAFLAQDPAILSVQVFPIFFSDQWWGFIGFDDCLAPREWDEQEILLLRTASEMIGGTIQRWQAQAELLGTLAELEQRVTERTQALSLTNTQLRKEIRRRQQFQSDLEKSLNIERILAQISARLVDTVDLDLVVDDVLQDLGEMIQAGWVSLALFELGEPLKISRLYDWHAPQSQTLDRELVGKLIESMGWIIDPVHKHQTLYVEDIAKLPQESQFELDFLIERGIRSMILLPLSTEGSLTGVMVCSNFAEGARSSSDQLRAFEMVGSMINSQVQRETLMRTLEIRVAERTRELSTLYEMAMLSSEFQDISDILHRALSKIREISNSEAACIHSYSANDQILTLVTQRGIPPEYAQALEHIPVGETFSDWLGRPEPVYSLDQNLPAGLPDVFCFPGFRSMFITKLRTAGDMQGIISCYRRGGQPFTSFQTSMLVAIGELLGVVVENYRLTREAEKLATVQERQRLGRELHDAVSQSLYSLTLFARSGRDALEVGDQIKLADSLEQLETNALITLREMRFLLYQLRSVALDEGGFVEAIEARFDMVERRLGIHATTTVDDRIEFPGWVEQELFRLVTEALNNALKHANASQVSLNIGLENEHIVLVVRDNGTGFDLSQVQPGMGLQNMRERTMILTGQLDISSSPEGGTQIRLVIPAAPVLARESEHE